ncbi:MAG TPA: MFS transporter [Candidatus Dormibacteraeota bacterium]|nr:MFS transporter [Candidatus Dormibacteraeota bacterium]
MADTGETTAVRRRTRREIGTATGLGTGSAITDALSVGVANVVLTVLAVLVLDRIGRRPLLITGTAGCVISLCVLGAFFAAPGLQHHVPWLALVCLITYIAVFAVGLGPVFGLMISEIFPLHVRSPAMSISTVGNWTANFIARVPETKDRTLEQIEQELTAAD